MGSEALLLLLLLLLLVVVVALPPVHLQQLEPVEASPAFSFRLCQCPRCQQMAAQPAQWVCSRHQHWRLHGGGDSLLAATPCCHRPTPRLSTASV